MAIKMSYVVAMCRRGVLNSKSKHLFAIWPLTWQGFIQIFGHILRQPWNFCKIVNGTFLTWAGVREQLGSEVYWFICGQLEAVLAGRHSVVFVLANMAGQARRCGA